MSVSALGSSYQGTVKLFIGGTPTTVEINNSALTPESVSSSSVSGGGGSASSGGSAGSAAESFVMNYANMTQAQQMMASVLSSMGLTQGQYNALPPDKRAQIDQIVRQKIMEQIDQQTEKKTGMIVDTKA